MYILNPDPYSLPCYRIGPFQTRDLANNHRLPDSDLIEDYFADRFKGKDYSYTYNGRTAIHEALGHYNLKPDDIVTILTTSGNFYVSSCVTHEIEKYCKWSREILPNTRLLLVNHEFGYPYENLGALREYNLPIIEDCAGSFFSHDVKNETGNIGDFIIYSFPKMFPLQIGGLLVSNKPGTIGNKEYISKDELRHVKNVLSSQISQHSEIIACRTENYKLLREKFGGLGFEERFPLVDDIVPGVFMFSSEGHELDLPELKKHYYAHGIQCSVFYGEKSFFIPVHQALKEEDIDYFVEVFRHFLNNSK
jgi:dTDP-4-amino-4,6-dideoxygalactose transaminase